MLGDVIKTLRQSHNLSQVDLAKKLFVSKQTVSNWENNNIMPSIEKLKDIARFFSCSTDYILEINNNSFYIDVSDLSPEQVAHIQAVVKDLQLLNAATKLNSSHNK